MNVLYHRCDKLCIETYCIIGGMFECDLYWSGEVGCGTSITLETGRDDWRGQTKHNIICVAA